jgi:DNA polymerase-3 subunit delta'
MATESDILEPRENPNLYGHEAVEAMLLADVKSGRLHHAYMFCGPKGIGKATLAYRFARYLLKNDAVKAIEMEAIKEEGLFAAFDMPQVKAPTPAYAPQAPIGASALYMDEEDPIFKRVAAGAHTDMLTLSPAYDAKKQQEKAEISVAEARKVGNFLALTPAESSWRVVIIDAVDQLNTQSM